MVLVGGWHENCYYISAGRGHLFTAGDEGSQGVAYQN